MTDKGLASLLCLVAFSSQGGLPWMSIRYILFSLSWLAIFLSFIDYCARIRDPFKHAKNTIGRSQTSPLIHCVPTWWWSLGDDPSLTEASVIQLKPENVLSSQPCLKATTDWQSESGLSLQLKTATHTQNYWYNLTLKNSPYTLHPPIDNLYSFLGGHRLKKVYTPLHSPSHSISPSVSAFPLWDIFCLYLSLPASLRPESYSQRLTAVYDNQRPMTIA